MRETGTLPAPAGTPTEVFSAFIRLGLTAFGGPIAHLGYFREAFVVRCKWLDDAAYADLVALCQFLPGPASSQVGFALGWLRAGPLGALAAFIAFTLPSSILLIAFALGASAFGGPIGQGIVWGLKIVAVAIVAQAVWGMAQKLTPDRKRITIALAAILVLFIAGGALGQIAAIVFGAMAGATVLRDLPAPNRGPLPLAIGRRWALAALVLFVLLLAGLPLIAGISPGLMLFDAFYRSGALVFGGGHVVLPLLEAETVARGWLDQSSFLAGYGAAQAVPGPLFTFAVYLGIAIDGLRGALIGLCAIFLPGFLLLVGTLPFWTRLREHNLARAGMAGTNAAVVGILAAALYDPVIISAITGPVALVLALICTAILMIAKAPPWVVVIVAALGGAAMGLVEGGAWL